MKKSRINSERSLKQVTSLFAKKLVNKVAIFEYYHVETEEWVKGSINHVVIWGDSHMLTKAVIDTAWEIIDEYEEKYESMCICGTIQTKPYLTKDGYTLHMPVIEICVRIWEER